MNSKKLGNKTTIKKSKDYIKDSNSNTLKRSDKRKLTPSYSNFEKTIEKIPKYSYRPNNEIKNILFKNKKQNDIHQKLHKKKQSTYNTTLNRKYSYSKININPHFEEKKGIENHKLRMTWSKIDLNRGFKIQNQTFGNDNKINELNQIINILQCYIKELQLQYNKKIKEIYYEKYELIKRLKKEKQYLIKENKELKFKILELFYIVKDYEKNEIKINNKREKIYSQILQENKYLRKSNCITDNINNSIYKKLINDASLLKEKQLTDNLQEKSLNLKKINNPFIIDDFDSENDKYLNLHKRQITYYNFNNNNDTNSNDENYENFDNKSISSISSLKTIVSISKDYNKDLLDETLKEMTLNNKIMKRNNNSKRNILESEKNKTENNILNSPQILSKKKQQQLYYITSKEEKSKILFTK